MERVPGNKNKYPSRAGRFTFEDVSTLHYRKFINEKSEQRSSDPQMQGAQKATVIQLMFNHDWVDGADSWRGRGDHNKFFKSKK